MAAKQENPEFLRKLKKKAGGWLEARRTKREAEAISKRRTLRPKTTANWKKAWSHVYGTYAQGDLHGVSYRTLVSRFGKPTEQADKDDYGAKTEVQWIVVFGDGTVANIYDWKTSPLYYMDEDGKIDPRDRRDARWATKNTEWTVGGKSKRSFELVKAAIGPVRRKKKATKKTTRKKRATKTRKNPSARSLRTLTKI
jgi:hypothetical protein